MSELRRIALIVLAWPLVAGEPPSLAEILKRLAENQEAAVEARKTVVYRQDTLVRLLRTNGKLSREEKRQYSVMPTETATKKTLEKFEGKYERGGKVLPYGEPGFQYKDTDLDGDLIEDLTDDLVNDKKSRDGFSKDMFPLTGAEQRYYKFELKGRKKVAGVEAWHIRFEPQKREDGDDWDGDRHWKGDVYVDPEEYQPLLVATDLSFKIPKAVKILLGIDLKQLGFQITYQKVAEGLWFPKSYGTEFGLQVFFGYKRNITMNVANSEFRRATAESKIEFGEVAGPAGQ